MQALQRIKFGLEYLSNSKVQCFVAMLAAKLLDCHEGAAARSNRMICSSEIASLRPAPDQRATQYCGEVARKQGELRLTK